MCKVEISIIIATYNAGKTLKYCLDSIIYQLNENCELIIIDGKSNDETIDIIDNYKNYISYCISEKDRGIYDAWNKGVKESKGRWIAFIGADDILIDGAIEKYLSTIKETKFIDQYDYICAHNEYIDYEGNILKVIGEEPKWSRMRYYMAPAHVASLHNKHNLFDLVGDYDFENFHICADYELLMRKKNHLKFLFLSCIIAKMKVGGMSFSTKAIVEAYKIRKKHHSIPYLINVIVFVKDWIGFKLFILRKIQLKKILKRI